MQNYYDDLEIRPMEERERDLFARLPALIRHAQRQTAWFAQALAHIEAETITDRAALARLPVLRKHQLIELQRQARPFGGLVAARWGELARVFASPGPIYEPENEERDYWKSARALFAAGFRAGDLIHNSFSYHMTPGAWILEAGARALGCTVFPAGVGQTEQQAQAIADLRPVGYVGTPSFLRIVLAKADELALPTTSLKKALVSGEALLSAHREEFARRGIDAYQAYATADLGVIAYETEAREGLVVNEGLILEIVRPGTNEPVPAGEVGEVVVTQFNPTYPLIRFATGDLSAVIPESLTRPSPCGRTNLRIRGWLGRADQTTKVRGMFVHPEQIDALVKRHPEVKRARLVVTNPSGLDQMVLRCECLSQPGLAEAIAGTLRELTKLRGEVELVAPGSLPNDGKVISDERRFE
ncbi:MAG: AMP-binding protein [Rhodocyclaceae bacterium]|nr:AMP-binding protein [Rhodocyclaceae bacterium]